MDYKHKFSRWDSTKNGHMTSKSEDDANVTVTIIKSKNEDHLGRLECIINKEGYMNSSVRLVTLIEKPEKGAKFGTPRTGASKKDYHFFRAQINNLVYKGWFFPGGLSGQLLVDVEEVKEEDETSKEADAEVEGEDIP